MPRCGWLAVIVLATVLGSTSVPAFEYSHKKLLQVQFRTSRPVDITQYTPTGPRPLGRSTEPVSLWVPDDDSKSSLIFQLSRPGYRTVQIEVQLSELKTHPIVPVEGTIDLVPLSPLVPLQDFVQTHNAPLLWGSLLVAFGLVFFAWPFIGRLRRHARRLRQLITPHADQDVNVGKTLGGYLLTRLLGRGGAASVYEGVPADNIESSSRVAIKVLHDGKASVEFRERFAREVNICKALNHPNLVRLLDWEEGRVFYLVMELVDGQSLRRHMTADGMDLVRAYKYLQGIFAGLAYAHGKGVVHCDLKPDNIMITAQDTVRVMDFGIATGKRAYQRLTHTNDVLGTPGWLAPEQLDGVRTDPRSDQYALGVIIFEMLSGRPPFECPDAVRLITMHLVDAPPVLCSVRPDIPEAVSDVVDRMLSKRPENRYASLEEAWAALANAAAFDRVSFDQRTVRISFTD